jgi:hypothetical protein
MISLLRFDAGLLTPCDIERDKDWIISLTLVPLREDLPPRIDLGLMGES